MKVHIGFVYKVENNYVSVMIPFHFFHSKYKKLLVKVKEYIIFEYKREYSIGDIVLFNFKNKKIYNFINI